MKLSRFLQSKPLYYKNIDHERIHKAYALLKPHISHPKRVQIVGTNAKGSTGRIMAHLAYSSFKKSALKRPLVGHYSSPHILRFNERIWIDGTNVDDVSLEYAHKRLFKTLGKDMSDKLSYFEYTTLLAFVLFEKCELAIIEAGLGGEHDATSVATKELSIITPIDIDHQSFLGENIEQIATTKLKSIDKKALIAPQIHKEVYEIAKRVAEQKGCELYYVPSKELSSDLEGIAKEKGWPKYMVENAKSAICALGILGLKYDILSLRSLELFGRFYPLRKNIYIDVGHNPLAAKAVVEAMKPDSVLVYNSLDDKDYLEVLKILKPKVKRVEIIRIDTQRAAALKQIEDALESLEMQWSYFDKVPNDHEEYLIFGSFYVVEAFLKYLS